MAKKTMKKTAVKTQSSIQYKAVPERPALSALNLLPHIGEYILIKATDRRDVETRFGNKSVTDVIMVTSGGAVERGSLFQAFAGRLELGVWYGGGLTREGMEYVVKPGIPDAVEKKLIAMAADADREEVSDDDIPF